MIVAIGSTEKIIKCMFGKYDCDSHVMLWRWYKLWPHLLKK